MKKQLQQGLRSGLALACTLSLALTVIPVHADEIDDLQSKTSELETQLANINQELLSINNEIISTEIQIEKVNEEINKTQQELAVATVNKETQYRDMKDRIKYIYENGNTSMLEMLFSAHNMADFVNKADFIQSISEYDRQMLNELVSLQDEIQQREKELSEQQVSLMELQLDLTERQDELKSTADATSTDLVEFEEQLDALIEEQARLDALAIQNALNNQGTSGNGTIINTTPVSTNTSDLELLAALIQHEAYQNYDYLLAVATVVMNRVASPLFPNTISEVIYAPGQFVTASQLASFINSNQITALSYKVAQDALNGARLLSVADCYYFLAEFATSRNGVNVGGNIFFQRW